MSRDKKTAFIIAGPNGSGKTTFSISLIKNTNILTGMHLNADIILRANENEEFLKNLTPLEQHLKISNLIDNKIDKLIEDPLINVQNVALRVEKGGHAVPIDKIFKRYKSAHENLSLITKEIDCLILIDNSIINQSPIIYTALSNGAKCFVDTEHAMPL